MQNFSLTPGAQIAHYRIEKRIGAGGMGEVFLATDLTLERQVALKILPPSLLADNDRVRRFVQEAKSASALNHPNIVTIYEIGQSPVTPPGGEPSGEKVHYMAMEFIEGQTLREMIYGNAPLRDVVNVLAQAADGLGKAHGAGIVHRDLKPDNIMVTSDGYAKVVDFGLAKLTEKKQETAGQDHSITQSGMVMGTVGYMSPEQIDGSIIRPPSDIFAFGCILYEAVAKKRPFHSDLAIDTLHKIMFSEPPPLTMHVADAPMAMQAIIDRCLKKNPDERYANMRDVAVALREFTGSGPTARPEKPLAPGYAAPPQSGGVVRPKIAVRPLDNIDEDDEHAQRGPIGRIFSLVTKLLVVAIAAMLIYVGVTLPDVKPLAEGTPAGVTAGTWSDYDDLAPSLRRAAVASLDADFFERRALRSSTIATAAKSINTPERHLYAPSPVTLAVARAVYGGSSLNPVARARNWAIAASMQSKLSDRRILELYLNLAHYGETTGAADAAKRYFNKSARKVSESEAALLSAAALVKGSDPAQPSAELTAAKDSILAAMNSHESTESKTPEKSAAEPSKKERSSSKKPKSQPKAEEPAPAPPSPAAEPPATTDSATATQ